MVVFPIIQNYTNGGYQAALTCQIQTQVDICQHTPREYELHGHLQARDPPVRTEEQSHYPIITAEIEIFRNG